MLVVSKLIYTFNAISIKIATGFLIELERWFLSSYGKNKNTQGKPGKHRKKKVAHRGGRKSLIR